MRSPSDPPSPEQLEALLDAQDARERLVQRAVTRKGPGLIAILAPLWIWVLGATFLPDETPLFARALFHATCWAGFAWLVLSGWKASKATKETGRL